MNNTILKMTIYIIAFLIIIYSIAYITYKCINNRYARDDIFYSVLPIFQMLSIIIFLVVVVAL
jgi:hypothetical protein